MKGYFVTKAAEEDWEDAMALAYRTFQKFEAQEYGEEGISNFVNFISDQNLYRMFLIDEYHLWVAKNSLGEIIGMGTLRSGNHISLLFVDEKWHRRGVGTDLLACFEEHVREGKKYDSLTVNASPFGIPFYHKTGFTDLGEQRVSGGMIITPMQKKIN